MKDKFYAQTSNWHFKMAFSHLKNGITQLERGGVSITKIEKAINKLNQILSDHGVDQI